MCLCALGSPATPRAPPGHAAGNQHRVHFLFRGLGLFLVVIFPASCSLRCHAAWAAAPLHKERGHRGTAPSWGCFAPPRPQPCCPRGVCPHQHGAGRACTPAARTHWHQQWCRHHHAPCPQPLVLSIQPSILPSITSSTWPTRGTASSSSSTCRNLYKTFLKCFFCWLLLKKKKKAAPQNTAPPARPACATPNFVICRRCPASSPSAAGLRQLECRRENNRGFQGLIRWHAKCIKFCRHFNSNMLDSWVSPEAAGFFISFTEGQSPLLPAPSLSLCCLSLSLSLPFRVPFSLCHHPSFPFSLSFFSALSPSLLLCACEIKDQAFVSSLVSGNSCAPCGLPAQR